MNHTLDTLVQEMQGSHEQKERQIHAAMLMAFYSAAHHVMSTGILTTPLFEIKYDHHKHHVGFEDITGVGRALEQGEYYISTFDLIFACNARDVPIIFEGDTGAGKTITTETYLSTILPPENSVMMSLSHQSFTDSPKAPFEMQEMRNGMPVTRIDKDALRRIAAMYIDELNLGNTNDLLQLSKGRVLLSRERGIAGISIPVITQYGVQYDGLKKMWMSGAQNPPKSRDAQFSGLELTASMKNRFLIIQWPHMVGSVGSTMWLVDEGYELHDMFLEEFVQNYSGLTGHELDLESVGNDWLDLYAFITDPRKTDKAIIRSALEFGDLLVKVLSGDLQSSYKTEKKVIETCMDYLPLGMRDLFFIGDEIQGTEEVAKLEEILQTFGKPLTERDSDTIKNMADLFATISRLKSAFELDSMSQSYQEFLDSPGYITIEDVANAATLITRNKQVKEGRDPLAVINSVLNEYVGLMDDLAGRMNIAKYRGFEVDNPSLGIKQILYLTSIQDADDSMEVVSRLGHYSGLLRSLNTNSEIRRLMIGRICGDLGAVAAFFSEYEEEAGALVQNQDSKRVREDIRNLYRRKSRSPSFDPVYPHRLPRVI